MDSCLCNLHHAGQFDFENAILESTKCSVYTFDWYERIANEYIYYKVNGIKDESMMRSTYDGSDIGPRHKYYKKCIGDEKKAESNPSFTTLSNAVKDLNIKGIKLLKIDIEGFEVDEIASWKVSNVDLPEQIAIEMHHSQVMYNSLNNPFDFSNLVCTFCTHKVIVYVQYACLIG